MRFDIQWGYDNSRKPLWQPSRCVWTALLPKFVLVMHGHWLTLICFGLGRGVGDNVLTFTPVGNSYVEFSTCSSLTTFDTHLRLYQRCGEVNPPCIGGYEELISGGDDPGCQQGQLQSTMEYALSGGQLYYLVIEGAPDGEVSNWAATRGMFFNEE